MSSPSPANTSNQILPKEQPSKAKSSMGDEATGAQETRAPAANKTKAASASTEKSSRRTVSTKPTDAGSTDASAQPSRKNKRANQKVAVKSGKRGGALLERALARASKKTETPLEQKRRRLNLAPRTGSVAVGPENRTSAPYDWVPIAITGATDGFDLDSNKRGGSIDLHELIAQTTSEVSRVHAEQAILREAILAAKEMIREQAETTEDLRRAIEANTTNNGARDAESAELRRDLSQIRTISDRRAEQNALLREKAHSMRSLEKENESLQRELTASDSLRRKAVDELSALRAEFDESQRETLQRSEDYSTLRDQFGNTERLAAKQGERIEQLLQSVERNEAAIAERDTELDSLRNALFESKRNGTQSIDEIDQLRRAREREQEEASARSQELKTLRDAADESECSARAQSYELEILRRSKARTEDNLRRRESEVAALREVEIDNERASQQRCEEVERLTHNLALRTDEVTRLRETIESNNALQPKISELEHQHKIQLAALRARAEQAEREISERMKEEETHRAEFEQFRKKAAEYDELTGETDREIALLNRELQSHKKHAGERDAEMVDLRQNLADLSDHTLEDDREKAFLDAKIEEIEPALTSAREEVDVLRESLESAHRTSRVEEEQARRYKEGLATAEQALAGRERELSELRASSASEKRAPAPSVELPDEQGALGQSNSGGEPQTDSAGTTGTTPLQAPPTVRSGGSANPPAANQVGWKLFPWRRRREVEQETPVPQVATAAPEEEIEVVPAVTGPPTFDAPADPGLPVSDRNDHPAIFHYWKRTQIASKLDQPHIGSADDFFLSYLLDLCKRNPERTNRVVSIGTGSHDLEVVLARRALDAGVTNFNIHCLAGVPSTLHTERAIAAERTILTNLTLLQCRREAWPIENPYSLVIVNNSLHELENPDLWVDRIAASLEPGARVLVHSPIVAKNGVSTPVAQEIADEIWRLMPERYKAPEHGGLERPHPAVSPNDEDDTAPDAPNVLQLLADRLSFEVFLAFGNVINTFTDEHIGMNFDPENERDRRFIDQVATVDDGKIDSGLIPPTQMLAALTVEPQDARIYKHWTPAFCLGKNGESTQ